MDTLIQEAKQESRFPKAQNGLVFGFLNDALLEDLNENNSWKERSNAIEAVESKLNQILSTERKMDFLPYSTNFLGFVIQFISDINFKISLTVIKIISKCFFAQTSFIAKLFQVNIQMNIKKYYT